MPKGTIVVVDDEEHARNAVARVLKTKGYTVHAMNTGQQAIDFAWQNPFDLLLADFRMPGGLDGLTTIRAVSRINPQIAAVIMTANNSAELAVQSLNLGVHGFVVKPFTAQQLVTTVQQTLERQQLTRENSRMKAVVDMFGTTEALITANTNTNLPALTVELALRKTASTEAFLWVLPTDGQTGSPELTAVAQIKPEDITKIEAVNSEIYYRTHETDLAEVERLVAQALESKANLFTVDGEIVAMGSYLPPSNHKFQCRLIVPMNVQGRVIGALVLRRSETEVPYNEIDLQSAAIVAGQAAIALENRQLIGRLASIEALREADKLRSEFVSTVSHELRTPLTSIKGYTTTLLRDDVNWQESVGREYLGIISEECDKLVELIDNILEVSKIEAGALKIYAEPVQIQEIAQRALTEAHRRYPEAKIKLEMSDNEEMPFVLADPPRINQVFRNLIGNAVKYSPGLPNVLIKLQSNYTDPETGRPMVLISSSDHGIGIEENNLDKVFARFYRVDTGATRRTEGSGLGLAICKGIVEAHKGQIWVSSEGLGQGTTFYFTLPITELSHPLLD